MANDSTTALDESAIMLALTLLCERGLLPSADYVWCQGLIAERVASGVLPDSKLTQAASLIHRHRGIAAEHGIPVPQLPAPTAPEPEQASAPRPGAAEVKITIARTGELMITGTPYAMREQIKALPGHNYDREGRKGTKGAWYVTASPATAAMAASLVRGHKLPLSMGAKAKALAVEHTQRRETAQILDPATPVPELDWASAVLREPWEHQLRGAEYLMRSSAAVLAVPMGGGKTATVIMALNLLEAQRVLVVCPNKVRGVWRRELRKHSTREWHVVDGRYASKRARAGWVDMQVPDRIREGEEALFDCGCGRPHMMCVNYEVLTHEVFDEWAPRARFDALVYDEEHRLGSHAAKTRSGGPSVSGRAASWVGLADHRWGLSGTPTGTDPAETLFGTYRALDPGIYGTVWDSQHHRDDGKPRGHKQRYQLMNPKVQNHVIGYQNLGELARLASRIMYRPVVHLDLPPSTTETVEVELDASTMKAYREMESELAADLAEHIDPTSPRAIANMRARVASEIRETNRIRAKAGAPPREYSAEEMAGLVQARLDDPETEISAPNPMVKLLRLQQLTGGVLSTNEGVEARVWDSGKGGTKPSPKGEALGEVLDQVDCRTGLVETDEHGWLVERAPEPVVVFCRFTSDLAQVREVVESRGLRYGEISGARSDGLTMESTMSPDADVVGVQIQAGGTGIELVRARIVVWWSIGYSLVDFDQAVKRVHRPGQERPVLNIHLVATGCGADEAVYAALNDRRSTTAEFYRLAGFDEGVVDALVGATHAIDDEAIDTLDTGVPSAPELVSDLHAGATSVAMPYVDQAEALGDGRVYKPRNRRRRKGAPTAKKRPAANQGAMF